MERPRPRNVALAALLGGIAVYELVAPDTETISEAFDPLLEGRSGFLIKAGVWITAAHILNAIPNEIDPFEQGLSRVRRLSLSHLYK